MNSSSLSVYYRNMDQLRDGCPVVQHLNSLFQLIATPFREQFGEKEPIDHPK